MTLVELSVNTVFSAFLVFCRVGTACMFLPGVGESYVSPRIRLIFAVMLSILLIPAIEHHLPSYLDSPLLVGLVIGSEVTLGFAIGIVGKLILSAVHTFGLVVSSQIGLSSAMMLDPSQGSQGSLIGNFISIIILMLIISMDLHLLVLQVFSGSYEIFPINDFSQYFDDFANMIIRVAATAWITGVKISAPFIIVGMLIFLGAGVLSRLMPQFQVFFLMLPAQILVGVFFLMITISGMALWFGEYYRETITNIFSL